MTGDIALEFVLLRTARAEVTEDQYATRPLGNGMHAALDNQGAKTLLIPVPEERLPLMEDLGSRGAHLVATRVRVDGQPHEYAALRCVDPALDLVFDRLASDVVTRVFEHDLEPLDACRQSLDDWRALLRRTGSLSESQVVGLHGELELLRRLGETDPAGALDWWVGSSKAIHDFTNGVRALEVKGTATLEGQSVVIHGLDQLDRGPLVELHLAVARCRVSPSAPSLDDRVRSLLSVGFPRGTLLDRLAEAGYLFESRDNPPTNYEIRDIRIWQVDEDFPGLRRSQFPASMQRGVSGVQYTLSVEALPAPMSESEVEGLLQRWRTH